MVLLCFNTLPAISQIRYIQSIQELEEKGNGWGDTLINIAVLSGGVAAVLSLVKVFKGIERGDQEVQKVAGGWFAAMSVFIIGVWFIKKFVMKN